MSKMQRAQLGTTEFSRTHSGRRAAPQEKRPDREGRIAMPFGFLSQHESNFGCWPLNLTRHSKTYDGSTESFSSKSIEGPYR